MTSKTTTQYTCDLCEKVEVVEGTLLPCDWGKVSVEVSWYVGTWAYGVVCGTCLESPKYKYPSRKESSRLAAKIYNLFFHKKNK